MSSISHATIGDIQPQEVKTKGGGYNHWSDAEHKMLLRLLVDGINKGLRDANNKFNKLAVETRILSKLNQELGSKRTYSQYRNRMKILKGKYQSLADFLRCSSGFGWDPVTKKFNADDEVWNIYLKVENHNIRFMNILVLPMYEVIDIYFILFNRLIQVIRIYVMSYLKI